MLADVLAAEAPAPTSQAWRREVKLLVHPEVRDALLDWLRTVIAPDPMAPAAYRVRSLYYDTDDMSVYRHKKDGSYRRFKLRLRIYPDSRDRAQGTLEIKWKLGDFAWKERCFGDLADLHELTQGNNLSPLLPSLPLLHAAYRFHPKIVVDYERHAFVGAEPERARVTLDGPVHVRKAKAPNDLYADGARSSLVARGYSVLELKFQNTMPAWQLAMTQRWPLPRVPFSKYVEAVHTLLAVAPYDLHFMPIKPINDDLLAGFQWA